MALWVLHKRTALPTELVYSVTGFTVMALAGLFVVIGFVYLVQTVQLLRRTKAE